LHAYQIEDLKSEYIDSFLCAAKKAHTACAFFGKPYCSLKSLILTSFILLNFNKLLDFARDTRMRLREALLGFTQ